MTERGDGLFCSNRLSVVYRSRNSASLVLEQQSTGEVVTLVLDLAASVQRLKKELDESGDFSSFYYEYSRYGVAHSFEVTPWWWSDDQGGETDGKGKESSEEEDTKPDEDANDSINALEFVFSQFTYALFTAAKAGASTKLASQNGSDGAIATEEEEGTSALAENDKINAVANAFEVAGKGVRTGLKLSGRGVGTAIRFLGAGYTTAAVKLGGAGSEGPREVQEEDLAYAQKQQDNCETFHAGARSVTGTILAPVRYIGMKAQALVPDQKTSTFEEVGVDSGNDGEGEEGTNKNSKSAGEEIMYGMGNGFVHAFKGITEFVSEVGQAVGDSALHHSAVVNGQEYSERVTKKHVDGAGQVGLGLYKVGTVASFGLAGVAAEAVFEGGMLLTALYDFLVGPVLLHAYMDVTFPPSTEPTRLYVVLRPWSVSFYRHSSEFAGKPFRVIPSAMMDTIPQMRHRAPAKPAEMEMGPLQNQSDASLAFASGAASSAEDLARLEASGGLQHLNDGYSVAGGGAGAGRRGGKVTVSLLQQLKSTRSHVELCTVDCSSALLHPLLEEDGHGDAESSAERALLDWFSELKQACERVEEVQKKNSGASEIAIARRLRMLPRKKVVWFELEQLTVKRDRREEAAAAGGRSVSVESDGDMPYSFLPVPTEAEGGAGNDHDAAADKQGSDSTGGAGAAAAAGQDVTFKDTLTNATLKAAKIRLLPVTAGGVRVSPEETWSEGTCPLAASESTPGALEADFGSQRIEMGRKASLDVSGGASDSVSSVLLTVKVQTIYGRDNAELGRVYVPIRAVLPTPPSSSSSLSSLPDKRGEDKGEGESDDRAKARSEEEEGEEGDARTWKDGGESLTLRLHRKGEPTKIVGSVQLRMGVLDAEEESASV